MSIELVMPSNHLILCHPLLLLPSFFPSIRVFFSESVLSIGWPKYWSFSFSISPSNEYSRLISFRMNWLYLLAVKGLSRVFSNYSAIKKDKVMLFAAIWVALEIIILSGISQKDKYMWYHLYVESKTWRKWTYLQNRTQITDMENRLVVAKRKGGGNGRDWEFRVSRCKPIHLE